MGSLFRMYQNALVKRPILTQAIQAGTLMFSGDLIAQKFIEEKKTSDVSLQRALKFGSIGFFIGGPCVRVWYGVLNKYVGSSGGVVIIKKVILDQLVYAPSFLAVALTCVGILNEKPLDVAVGDVKQVYWGILRMNWCVWPFVQLVNFYMMPLKYQALFSQTISLFWHTYVSWLINRKRKALTQICDVSCVTKVSS